MHNSTLKFYFSFPSDHVWNKNCKVFIGFQLSKRAGFTSSCWQNRWGFQDYSLFSPTFFPQGGEIAFCWLGLPEPLQLWIQSLLCFTWVSWTGLSIKLTRLWGHICGPSAELLPWVDALTHHNRYKNLHLGISPFYTTGSFRKIITISLHTSDRTHGTHTECAKPFQKRDYYFPKHTTVQVALNRTLFDAADLWILVLNFNPEKALIKRQESSPLPSALLDISHFLLPLSLAMFLA